MKNKSRIIAIGAVFVAFFKWSYDVGTQGIRGREK